MYDAKDLYGNLGVRQTNAETNMEKEELEVMAQSDKNITEVLPADKKNIWIALLGIFAAVWFFNFI